MSNKNNRGDLKKFFIKLFSIVIAIIIIINVTYNLIFAEKLESINKVLMLNNKNNIEQLKDKLRLEIKKGLEKDKILSDEDAFLIYKFYNKIKKEIINTKKN
jgi:cell division protein YceG involved in septum cleavage